MAWSLLPRQQLQASTSPRCEQRASPSVRRQHLVRCPAVNPHLQPVLAAAVLEARASALSPSPSHGKPQAAPPAVGGAPSGGSTFDIIGLGQAVVDYAASVPDAMLAAFQVPKGGRRVVTVEERGAIMEALDDLGCPSQVSPGGSLANTLVAVARLGRAARKDLAVSMAGSLGTDTLGQYFNSQLGSAGVQVLAEQQLGSPASGCVPTAAGVNPYSDAEDELPSAAPPSAAAAGACSVSGHTGTVMVLTTPDAQRSFLSFFISEQLALPEPVALAVRSSRLVMVEGYMWEAPGAEQYIQQVVAHARAAGVQVALTAGDPGVVQRHRDEILRLLRGGAVDMLFANAEEAAALVAGAAEGGMSSALELAQLCPVVVVTDGSKGSYISAMGQMHVIPPHWTPHGPVDTCGAGDAYAAGVLYAALAGYDLRTAGEFGARVASAVISQFGPHLSEVDAEMLVRQLPEHMGPMRVSFELGAAIDVSNMF